jgi:hypothetical protein
MRTFHFTPESDREQRLVFQEAPDQSVPSTPNLETARQSEQLAAAPAEPIQSPEEAGATAASEISEGDKMRKQLESVTTGDKVDLTEVPSKEMEALQKAANIDNSPTPEGTEKPQQALPAPENAEDYRENLQARFEMLAKNYGEVNVKDLGEGKFQIDAASPQIIDAIVEKAGMSIHQLQPFKETPDSTYMTITIGGYDQANGYYGPKGGPKVENLASASAAESPTATPTATPAEGTTSTTTAETTDTTTMKGSTELPKAAEKSEAGTPEAKDEAKDKTAEQIEAEKQRAEAISKAEEKAKSEYPEEAAEGKRELKELTEQELDRQAAEEKEQNPEAAANASPESATTLPEEVESMKESGEKPEDQERRLMVETHQNGDVDKLIAEKPKDFEDGEATKDANIAIETNSDQILQERGIISGLELRVRSLEATKSSKFDTKTIDAKINELNGELSKAKARMDRREKNHQTMVHNQEIRKEQVKSDITVLGEMKEKTETLAKRADGRVKELASKIDNLGEGELAQLVRQIGIEHDGALGLKVQADEYLANGLPQGYEEILKSPPRLLAGLNALVKKTEKGKQGNK